MDLANSVLPLVGVIVGAGATFLATAATERMRWQRTHSVRWDERRLDAYIQYGDAVKRMYSLGVRICVHRGFDFSAEPLEPVKGLPLLAAASAERSARWEAVLLLGDSETIAAARAWHQAIWRIEWYARGLLDDNAEWAEAISQADTARHIFYLAARHDLGMPAPEAAPNLWPPTWLQARSTQPETASPG